MEDRQTVVTLTDLEHCLERPDMYIGAVEAREHIIPDASTTPMTFRTVVESPALVALANELSTNAADNVQRNVPQKSIDLTWDGTHFIVSNDGSALPVLKDSEGRWPIQVAFGTFRSGTNFDNKDTGKKDAKYTAGRNGYGSKGCNAFGTMMTVAVGNATDKKEMTVTWRNNMSVVEVGKSKAWSRKTNRTTVTWCPDYERLRTSPANMSLITSWLAHNVALCVPSSVKVTYNSVPVAVRTPKDVCNSLGADGPVATDVVVHDGVEVMRLAVAARDEGAPIIDGAGLSYAFVNSTWCREGSHAKMIFAALGNLVEEKANSRRGVTNIRCTPSFLRQHAIVVATLLVDNEQFTSQTKTCLDTPASRYGWEKKWSPSSSFTSAVQRSPLVDRVISVSRDRTEADVAKATKVTTSRHPSFGKYEPALARGTDATLVVCEGDSAGNFVRSGLASVGRRKFGLYPLRGKFLNTRGIDAKSIVENKEAMELLKILGLQLHTTYTEAMVAKLPYGRLMVATDQDVDGSHIAGLVFNFIDTCAPSLLAIRPDYLCRFATSLIRVSLGGKSPEIGFYSQIEYDTWCEARRAASKPLGKSRYFKGLGTSSASLAKDYFRDLATNSIVVRHTGEPCRDAMDLFFNKKRADDRKDFLTNHCDPNAFVPYENAETRLVTFVHDELLPQYGLSTLRRAIASLDGFKDATRKILYGARALGMKGNEGISVANAAGKIASHTNYHHRGTAMEQTIIGMAADYAGTSNINLLKPLGQFGTRYKHAAASAAYPKIALNDPIQNLLYPSADDSILDHIVEEGLTIEPRTYYPIVAMPLVLGTKGIATGWSTDIPQHHPLDVVNMTLAHLDGAETLPSVLPWYRGFDGSVLRLSDTSFAVRGTYHWEGNDLHVTEVPPHREVEAYKDDWIKHEFASEVFAGAKNVDEKVHIILSGCTLSREEDLTAKLGLEARGGYGNMHLLDEKGLLCKYESVDDIVRAHATMRVHAYRRRIAHAISVLERRLVVARNKATFIELVVTGRIDLRRCEDDDAAHVALHDVELDEVDGTYEYLLEMNMRNLTVERSARLRAQVTTLEGELEATRALVPEDEWRRELTLLRTELERDPSYARG